jgi:hypothetical protein
MTPHEARALLRLQLGTDWEERLILAGAIVDPAARDGAVDAARQRAVDLVCTSLDDWRPETRIVVGDAWFTLWSAA